MRAHPGARHREAKASAIGLAGKKRLENMIGDSAGDPGAVVCHGKFECTARMLTADFDDLARRGDVNRIVNADHQRCDELIGLAQGESGGNFAPVDERDGFLLGPCRRGLQARLQEFVRRHGFLFQSPFAN